MTDPRAYGAFSQESLVHDEELYQGDMVDGATPTWPTASADNADNDNANSQQFFTAETFDTSDDPTWSPALA